MRVSPMTWKSQRKSLFVSRDIQGKLLGRLVKYWILYHLALWTVMFMAELFRSVLVGGPNGAPRLGSGELLVKFAGEHWLFLAMPVVLFPVILGDMLCLTHHVAGPLVRFGTVLRDLAAGRSVERIQLRKGDLLTEFQDVFNEFLDSDRQRKDESFTPSANTEPGPAESDVLESIAGLRSELVAPECQASPAPGR
jgi:hypothetical protein